MKKMKKVFATMLAATMVVSTSLTAFAASTSRNWKNAEKVPFEKVYKASNSNAVEGNVAETFIFNIENYRVTDAGKNAKGEYITKDNMPKFNPERFEIAFEKEKVTEEGVTESVNLVLPEYDTVGIYTYKITEVPGEFAGVTYDTTPIYMKVTVTQDTASSVKNLIRNVTYHYGSEDGSKTANITNGYNAGTLNVTKTVTGNLGDKTKYFAIKVKLTGNGKDYTNNKIIVGGGSLATSSNAVANAYEENPGTIAVGGEYTFYLKHGDTITLNNIPYGVSYTVDEVDDSCKGYTETVRYGDDAKKIDSDADTVTVTNDKASSIDTGILLDSAPYILMLALAAVGMFVFVSKKREEDI